jgi:hypothetical protein
MLWARLKKEQTTSNRIGCWNNLVTHAIYLKLKCSWWYDIVILNSDTYSYLPQITLTNFSLQKSFQELLRKQNGDRAIWEYPFAVAGVNITFMLIQMLDLQAGMSSNSSCKF